MLRLPSSSSSFSSSALTGSFHSVEKDPFGLSLMAGEGLRRDLRGEVSREMGRFFFPVCSSGSFGGVCAGVVGPKGGGFSL